MMPGSTDAPALIKSTALAGGNLTEVIERFKADPESVYNTWFVNSAERLKAFRSIRRGVKDVVEAIAVGTFGSDFKGSPLEFVLNVITEQKQVFAGAAHPFYWKPKLRIPDIYETVGLIDVIWIQPGSGIVVGAFEIEKSTSIYSGILRMEDLARSIPGCVCRFYLVAPDRREKEVMAQLSRPAFRADLAEIPFAFIPFADLCRHADSLCTLGDDHTILEKISRRPVER